MAEVSTLIVVSFALTMLVMIGWAAWSIREYRRTGRQWWLYLALLMGVSLLVSLVNLGRLLR